MEVVGKFESLPRIIRLFDVTLWAASSRQALREKTPQKIVSALGCRQM
jgi:hypothetical protein